MRIGWVFWTVFVLLVLEAFWFLSAGLMLTTRHVPKGTEDLGLRMISFAPLALACLFALSAYLLYRRKKAFALPFLLCLATPLLVWAAVNLQRWLSPSYSDSYYVVLHGSIIILGGIAALQSIGAWMLFRSEVLRW